MATAQQIDFLLAGYRHPATDIELSGGKVKTYLDGTSTLSSLWTDSAKSGSADNPIILDSAGKAEVYGDNVYKFEIYDSDDVLIETINGLTYRPKSTTTASLSLDYGCDLTAAIVAISSTVMTLKVDCETIIPEGTSITTPTTLSVDVVKGGSFDGVSGGGAETLTINGPFKAGIYPIFGENLTVTGTIKTDKIYPEWFGYVPDGTTDVVPYLQKALDLDETSGVPVYLTDPSFPYVIDSVGKTVNTFTFGVTMASNTEIIGLPGATIKAGANLPITAAAIGNKSGDTSLDVRTDSNIKISGVIFDGSGRSYPAWDTDSNPATYGGLSAANARGYMTLFWSVDGITIDKCEVKDHDSISLAFGGCNNLKLMNNDVHDCGKVDDISGGFWISKSFPNLTTGKNTYILNNYFHDLDRLPFLAGATLDGGIVSGNIIKDVKEAGMYFPGPISNFTITGNEIDGVVMADISSSGMEIGDCVGLSITGNSISNTGRSSIAFIGVEDSVIVGNLFKNYGQTVTYPTQPQSYANGTAGTAMADPLKSGVLMFTGGTSEVNNVKISANEFLDGQVSPTGSYNVYLSQYVSLVTYGKLEISGNDMRSGGTVDTIGYSGAPSSASTEILIFNNPDVQGKTAGQYGYPVQNYQLYREIAATGNETIGNIGFYAADADGNRTQYAALQANAFVATAGSEQGRLYFNTSEDGTPTARGYIQNGLVIGDPTGADKGAGTINAVAVYDDGSILTDYVYDGAYDGKIDKKKWDSDKADSFSKNILDHLDIEKWVEYQKKNRRLPSFPSKETWKNEGSPSVGDLTQRLWEALEVQAIHIAKLHERIKALE
jgi:hypothetical protein